MHRVVSFSRVYRVVSFSRVHRLLVCLMSFATFTMFIPPVASAADTTASTNTPSALPSDTTARQEEPRDANAPHVLTKSPTTSVLLSLACPGLGQFYYETYWKIPLFTGMAAGSAWMFFVNNAKFNEADAAYEAALANPTTQNPNRALTTREVYRDNRDLAGLVFLVTYALAAVDAYVGAHLYDFDVDEYVSLGFGPTRTQLMALSLSVKMP